MFLQVGEVKSFGSRPPLPERATPGEADRAPEKAGSSSGGRRAGEEEGEGTEQQVPPPPSSARPVAEEIGTSSGLPSLMPKATPLAEEESAPQPQAAPVLRRQTRGRVPRAKSTRGSGVPEPPLGKRQISTR